MTVPVAFAARATKSAVLNVQTSPARAVKPPIKMKNPAKDLASDNLVSGVSIFTMRPNVETLSDLALELFGGNENDTTEFTETPCWALR